MGEGFQFIDIVLFAMIAAFLILRLRSVLGRHRDHGRPEDGMGDSTPPQRDDNIIPLPEQAKTTPPAAGGPEESDPTQKETPIDAGFTQIQIAAPDFDRTEFLVGVRTAFEMIIQAFAEGDRDLLEALLSDEVYGNFVSAMTGREDASETLENTLIRMVSAEPIEAYMDGSVAHVTVKIVSEQINVTRDAEGEVVDGDPDHVSEITDIWTFARDTQIADPNWALVATRSLD
ncbi:MAG: hypothetical protein CBD27_05080 [Rhodospirillaceae bacterium TMED167]|nr:translocase [Rhodospirillaceae bacterium]OUW28087.1 MAG: hypothetical protein CBD27_05080 [Rhodospirillaceae bacterium TMED167]